MELKKRKREIVERSCDSSEDSGDWLLGDGFKLLCLLTNLQTFVAQVTVQCLIPREISTEPQGKT